MALTLSVLRCPDAVPPETRTVTGGEFSIGRGPDNQWTLADPDKFLSKRHCVLAFRSGGWQLADVSTNGTFLNRDTDPVGAGAPRDLRDGDRLRLGNYEIEIRIAEEAAGWGGAAGGGQAGGRAGGGGSFAAPSFADPFGDDPFGTPPAGGGGFGKDPMLEPGGFGGIAPPAVTLPADFDPLGGDFDAPFSAPTQSDHASALEQSFRSPTPAPPGLPPDLDDWDLDLSPTPAPAAAPAPPAASVSPPAAFAPPPLVPPHVVAQPAAAPPMAAPPIAVPEDALADPFAEADVESAPFVPPAPAQPAPAQSSPAYEPPAEAPVTPAPRPALAPAAAAVPAGDLMTAFLRGAGVEDARPADPLATMERLGGAFRALVAGVRQALIARAAVKGEFRIEQTMIRARGNNPLKFSAGDDDALAALLGAGRRSEMAPADAIADALRDMRLHELATMAAMQSAVRALLERLDPAPLRAEAEKGGGLLPAQRRARAFDSFEKLHGEISRALADDFDSVFGKAFARAYEQALREASAKDRPE
ncbi:MAG: hypothetical protein BGP12_16335 [Rhodospirillales bacterium 70-18]|nr:MAG: hypothetical protein BGP12_16335 [Rhodospirillales bacterium 70-18]